MISTKWINRLQAQAVKRYESFVSEMGTPELIAIAQKNHRDSNTFVKCIVSSGVVLWEVNGNIIPKASLLEMCE